LYLGHGDLPHVNRPHFELSVRARGDIDSLLAEAGYGVSAEDLLDYIAAAIRLRESAKFHFSHNISDALSAISAWGEEVGLTRDELSYLSIESVLSPDPRNYRNEIEQAKARYRTTRAMRLSHLLTMPEDAYVVRLPLGQPNFITHKAITAPAVVLEPGVTRPIEGAIVLIESADPGFDWIFLHRIAGLVTKYGGANSHMAIRCAEFGLPAAIGCGERAFSSLAKARVIELNPGGRAVRAVN
jgi:hypothetical protein